jgi:hypothetical protein
MKALDFMQATISHDPKDPYSKALEPECLYPLHCDYDTVPAAREEPAPGFPTSSKSPNERILATEGKQGHQRAILLPDAKFGRKLSVIFGFLVDEILEFGRP